MHSENEVVYLYLDDIIPNRFQPREVFDDRALQELAMSIKEHGVIQPIIVRQIGEKYEIIAGERRYKASAMAGLTKIPAIVRNLDDKESSKVALLENLQRRDLNSIEEARTYQKILELDQMTQEELAKTMGKSQSAIANKLRLLTLPEEIQDAVLNEKISERHARSLLALETPQQQIEMMNKVMNQKMTVRELDAEIKAMKNPNSFNLEDHTEERNSPVMGNKPRFIDYGPYSEEPALQSAPIIDSLNENPSGEEQEKYPKMMADLDYLLNLDIPSVKETPSFTMEEEKEMSLEQQLDQKLREIPASNNPDDDIEELFPEEGTTNYSSPMRPIITEENLDTTLVSLKDAILKIRNLIQELERKGLPISSEEIDLENLYQIVIKIAKDK